MIRAEDLMGALMIRLVVTGACVVGAVLASIGLLSAQVVKVPHAAGTVYVPLDPSGRPAFPPAAPAAPGSPKEPASPGVPGQEAGVPGASRGGGFHVVPPSRDRIDPPGGGYQVVPRP
jgi:hypothetical protein